MMRVPLPALVTFPVNNNMAVTQHFTDSQIDAPMHFPFKALFEKQLFLAPPVSGESPINVLMHDHTIVSMPIGLQTKQDRRKLDIGLFYKNQKQHKPHHQTSKNNL